MGKGPPEATEIIREECVYIPQCPVTFHNLTQWKEDANKSETTLQGHSCPHGLFLRTVTLEWTQIQKLLLFFLLNGLQSSLQSSFINLKPYDKDKTISTTSLHNLKLISMASCYWRNLAPFYKEGQQRDGSDIPCLL